ncbi:MAG TPA: lysoplasmalogenase family protein, partial [Magnetospirillaceae bacterium]|nr:lysoplasmalogenase family protein [Magnetospirillaceae bacterium]
LIFRLRVYHPGRPRHLMRGGFLYGFVLGAMAAAALAAALARGGTWILVAAGALFFLLSDAAMGETTLHGRHPRHEYQVPWGTYIVAQGLILAGTAAALFT